MRCTGTCDNTTFDSKRAPPPTTAAAVSSQEVSMPRMSADTAFILGGDGRLGHALGRPHGRGGYVAGAGRAGGAGPGGGNSGRGGFRRRLARGGRGGRVRRRRSGHHRRRRALFSTHCRMAGHADGARAGLRAADAPGGAAGRGAVGAGAGAAGGVGHGGGHGAQPGGHGGADPDASCRRRAAGGASSGQPRFPAARVSRAEHLSPRDVAQFASDHAGRIAARPGHQRREPGAGFARRLAAQRSLRRLDRLAARAGGQHRGIERRRRRRVAALRQQRAGGRGGRNQQAAQCAASRRARRRRRARHGLARQLQRARRRRLGGGAGAKLRAYGRLRADRAGAGGRGGYTRRGHRPGLAAGAALGGEYFGERRGNGTALEVNSTALRQLSLRGAWQAAGTWQASWFGQSEDFASTFTSVAADRNSERLVLEQQVPSLAQGAALAWSGDRATRLGALHAVAGGSWRAVSAVDHEVAPLAPSPLRDNDGRQRLAGGYGELELAPSAALSFVAALRADHWRNYDAFAAAAGAATPFPDRASHAWSPSLGAVWHPRGPVSFRASAYESFRAPTLNELYRPFRVGNVETLANPALAAERYRGGQLGLDAALGRRGLVRATYFDGTVANAIINVTLAATPALITQQRQNLGRLRSRGAEFDGRWRPAQAVELWAAFTHLDSVVISAPNRALIGAKTPHVPRNAGSLRLLARRRGWTFSAEERYGGAEFDNDLNTLALPGYWSTDLFASRSWGAFAPYFAVENLWNHRDRKSTRLN